MVGAVLIGLGLGGALALGWYLGTGRSAPEVATPAPQEQTAGDDIPTHADPERPDPTAPADQTAADRTSEPDADADAVADGPGWIVIVESLDAVEYGREDAERIADGYRARGLDTEVLLSDEYGSLNAGYWVVHVGGWWPPSGEDAAASHCRSIRDTVANCYQRFAGERPPAG